MANAAAKKAAAGASREVNDILFCKLLSCQYLKFFYAMALEVALTFGRQDSLY